MKSLCSRLFTVTLAAAALLTGSVKAFASDTDLILPDLSSVSFYHFGGMNGKALLTWGILICIFGLAFGMYHFMKIKALKVHKSMSDVSELIYETCKTYLLTQGKFIIILEIMLAAIIVVYFGYLRHFEAMRVSIIIACSVVGIMGSYTVAWFGMRINTRANSRTAFASLYGKPVNVASLFEPVGKIAPTPR